MNERVEGPLVEIGNRFRVIRPSRDSVRDVANRTVRISPFPIYLVDEDECRKLHSPQRAEEDSRLRLNAFYS